MCLVCLCLCQPCEYNILTIHPSGRRRDLLSLFTPRPAVYRPKRDLSLVDASRTVPKINIFPPAPTQAPIASRDPFWDAPVPTCIGKFITQYFFKHFILILKIFQNTICSSKLSSRSFVYSANDRYNGRSLDFQCHNVINWPRVST